jgi:hypothetical protein
MTANLNALVNGLIDVGQSARAIVEEDVAHHVVDPDDLLGIDSLLANELARALPQLVEAEPKQWILVLPIPGRLGSLRGPRELNEAALQAGQAVVASNGALALVPYQLGTAVQWRVFPAERPFTPPPPYDAERALSEAVLQAGATLTRLDVAGGPRPKNPRFQLATGYDARQQASARRSLQLLVACNAALTHDGASLSSFEAGIRFQELRSVRDAASQALCATASWLNRP